MRANRPVLILRVQLAQKPPSPNRKTRKPHFTCFIRRPLGSTLKVSELWTPSSVLGSLPPHTYTKNALSTFLQAK